jgi:fructose-bisphosphate aldolase, class I
MSAQGFGDTARALVASGKGLLAMDESTSTRNRRFARVGIQDGFRAKIMQGRAT